MRRSKKQPEYDPNELADLIATPAVGSGVGSHLLTLTETTTVVTTELPPVDTTQPAPIVPGRKTYQAPPPPEAPAELTTVAESDLPTVVISEAPSVDIAEATTVRTWPEVNLEPTTVVNSPAERLGKLWISHSGEIVPESRVHRVVSASDALSVGEETLYNLLWRSPALRQTDQSRSVQAGYDSLTKRTGFSRKTIQRTIDRLMAKHYIEIETPADIYRRTPTVYRVFGSAAILERLIRKDCTHVARIGPGVAFVSPLSTVVTSDPATIVTPGSSTVDHS